MNRFVIPKDDRWMVCDEQFEAFLTDPVTPARLRRLQRESALGGMYADIQLVRERAYDKETARLLRDARAVDQMKGKTA